MAPAAMVHPLVKSNETSNRWSYRVFTIAWLLIMAVSIYDACLLFKLREVIEHTERNPVGLWLIKSFGSVWLFILLKVIGTLIVCTVLRILVQYYHRIGLVVTLALAFLQSLLFLYLTF